MIKIKICNVKQSVEVESLATAGVDIAGFRMLEAEIVNSEFKSKIDVMQHASSKGLQTSVVTDCADLTALAAALSETSPNYLQLHRRLSPDDVQSLRAAFPNTELVGLRTYEDLLQGQLDPFVTDTDLTVLDWAAGGTGRFPSLDFFERIDGNEAAERLIVAGGLNHVNVTRLLEKITPFGVDLDSGVKDPYTREICPWKTTCFVEAVRKFEQNHPADILPGFSAVNKQPWSTISSEKVDHSELVARSRLLSIIEDTDKYNNSHASISQRIREALENLQAHPEVKSEWLDAALIAFGSTIYFPTKMLRATLQYLFLKLEEEIGSDRAPNQNIIEKFHLFTNDPGALNEEFFRRNGVHGRLDQDKHARVGGVADLGSRVADLLHKLPTKIENARAELGMIFDRNVWVLLADQSLSGHSLEGDLEKLLWIMNIVEEIDPRQRKIVALCQVMTNTAHRNLMKNGEIKRAIRSGVVTLHSAIFLGEEHNVLSSECIQTMNENTRSSLLELCRWFAQEYIVEDKRYGRMLRKSGDNLEYGYRRAGLLIARQENCPTDSLPILWYEGTGKAGISYQGPYPRVNSRIDEQKNERTGNQWDEIRQNAQILSELQTLARIGASDG